MLTRDAVFKALRAVPEPCSIAMSGPDATESIVSMGLVESIEITDGDVVVSLVLTDASCIHFNGMTRYITDVLTRLSGVQTVRVITTTTQLWTPDRMNPTAAPYEPGPRTLLPLISH